MNYHHDLGEHLVHHQHPNDLIAHHFSGHPNNDYIQHPNVDYIHHSNHDANIAHYLIHHPIDHINHPPSHYSNDFIRQPNLNFDEHQFHHPFHHHPSNDPNEQQQHSIILTNNIHDDQHDFASFLHTSHNVITNDDFVDDEQLPLPSFQELFGIEHMVRQQHDDVIFDVYKCFTISLYDKGHLS